MHCLDEGGFILKVIEPNHILWKLFFTHELKKKGEINVH
jgi:hypothetical protein